MKKAYLVTALSYATILTYCACSGTASPSPGYKDLDMHMMDLKIYQENLGDNIRANNLDMAEWLLEGMDSILRVVARDFPEHRKMQKPFSYYYDKDMSEPVSGIRRGLKSADTSISGSAYRTLVRKCNGCHVDHDIDKIVRY